MTLLKVQVGDYEFAPSIVGTVLTLCLFILLTSLGFWQLSRMDEKRILEKNLRERLHEEAIQLQEPQAKMISQDFEGFRYQPVQVTGSFLNDRNILLDNQIYQGQAGYHVITPFLSKDTEKLILVDRGWIPWGEDRSDLPDIPVVSGIVTIKGIINHYPAGLNLKKEETPSDLWPYRVQSIDYLILSELLNAPVFPFIVQLQKGDPYTFKVPPIYFGLSSDRHLGYAIQWFMLAIATVIYYVIVNLRRLTDNDSL